MLCLENHLGIRSDFKFTLNTAQTPCTDQYTQVTYLEQIKVSVELSTFSVLQSFELSRDEHENVLRRERITVKR